MLLDARFWAALQGVDHLGGRLGGAAVPDRAGDGVASERAVPGNGAVRTIILLPWVVSGVVTGTIGDWLFDGTRRCDSDFLLKAASQRPDPLGHPTVHRLAQRACGERLARGALLRDHAAGGAPEHPTGPLRAGQGGGAGRWSRFRYITLPLISGAIILSTLLRAIWTFNYVDLVWTMTHGGTGRSTRTLAIEILQVAYIDGDFGYAAALSVGLVIILLVFSALYWRLNRFGHVA